MLAFVLLLLTADGLEKSAQTVTHKYLPPDFVFSRYHPWFYWIWWKFVETFLGNFPLDGTLGKRSNYFATEWENFLIFFFPWEKINLEESIKDPRSHFHFGGSDLSCFGVFPEPHLWKPSRISRSVLTEKSYGSKVKCPPNLRTKWQVLSWWLHFCCHRKHQGAGWPRSLWKSPTRLIRPGSRPTQHRSAWDTHLHPTSAPFSIFSISLDKFSRVVLSMFFSQSMRQYIDVIGRYIKK